MKKLISVPYYISVGKGFIIYDWCRIFNSCCFLCRKKDVNMYLVFLFDAYVAFVACVAFPPLRACHARESIGTRTEFSASPLWFNAVVGTCVFSRFSRFGHQWIACHQVSYWETVNQAFYFDVPRKMREKWGGQYMADGELVFPPFASFYATNSPSHSPELVPYDLHSLFISTNEEGLERTSF